MHFKSLHFSFHFIVSVIIERLLLLCRLAELRKSLSELYLSFNKLTVLDPCIGCLSKLLMLDLR